MPGRAFPLLSIAVLTIACGCSVTTTDDASPKPQQATGPLDVENACLAPAADSAAPDPRLRSLKGRWLLDGRVEGESHLLMPDSVGLEINEDGRFRELSRNTDGALERRRGFDVEGRIELDETAETTVLTGSIARPNGYVHIGASVDGRTLRLDADLTIAKFVATDEAPVNRCPTQPGARLGAAACALRETSIHLHPSPDEIRARLIGRWVNCAPTAYGEPSTGFEFTADGHWYVFDGRTRWEHPGTFVIDPGGVGSSQVDMIRDGWTSPWTVSFADSPVELRLDGTGPTSMVLAASP